MICSQVRPTAAKADNVWWPNLALVASLNVELVTYPNTGVIDIPLTVANPGEQALTIRPQLPQDARFSVADGSDVVINNGGTKELRLRFDTSGVSTPGTYVATAVYVHSEAGVLGSTQVAVKVPSPGDLGAGACEQARQARGEADLKPYQAPALDAFLRTCQTMPISIDIKPGDSQNVINSKTMGKVPVAVLGSATFNPTTAIKTGSLTFGQQGTEPGLASCNEKGEDVNGDGHVDLLCHFQVKVTALTTASATGDSKTFGVTPDHGSAPDDRRDVRRAERRVPETRDRHGRPGRAVRRAVAEQRQSERAEADR